MKRVCISKKNFKKFAKDFIAEYTNNRMEETSLTDVVKLRSLTS